MSKTIEGIPEYFTHEQYVSLFTSAGVDSKHVVEFRMAADGIHVVLFATDEDGKRILDHRTKSYVKNRIFIPVRREPDDVRVTRVTEVGVA